MTAIAMFDPKMATPVLNQLHSVVAELDFSRLKHKYTTGEEPEMAEAEWDFGEKEYRRFLSLKAWYPSVELVPNKLVDKVWHAHILDTMAYAKDCEKVFGFFLHHFPYFGIYGKEDYQQLVTAFDKSCALYERHFGPYPDKSQFQAMRCAGHACHVPTECACRTPEACK